MTQVKNHVAEEIRRTVAENAKSAESMADAINLGDRNVTAIPVDFTNSEGRNYTGTVVFKRPSFKDTLRMGAIKSEIFREVGVKDIRMLDSSTHYIASMAATLEVVVTSAPEWFNARNDDFEITDHIFTLYDAWINSFRIPSEPEDGGGSKASSSEEAVAASQDIRG